MRGPAARRSLPRHWLEDGIKQPEHQYFGQIEPGCKLLKLQPYYAAMGARMPKLARGFWSRFLGKQLIIVFLIFVAIILITEGVGFLTDYFGVGR